MSPNYVSKEGVFFPAKEKVGLINRSGKTITVEGKEVKDGEPYIYEGVDRAALYELYLQGTETMGQNFRQNPEFLANVRNQGFSNVDEYLKAIGYEENMTEEEFEKKISRVNKHELPKKVAAVKVLGGGKDFAAQGEDKYGSFDKPKEL